jgi:hypothetical protein
MQTYGFAGATPAFSTKIASCTGVGCGIDELT